LTWFENMVICTSNGFKIFRASLVSRGIPIQLL
jgi:hypothetical protein